MMIFHIELKHTVYFIFLRNVLKGELNCTKKDCLTTDIFYKKISGSLVKAFISKVSKIGQGKQITEWLVHFSIPALSPVAVALET